MRRLLLTLFVLVALIAAVGFYRGWFNMSNSSNNSPAGSGDINVNLSTDRDKFNQDMKTIKDKASDISGDSTKETSPR